MIPHITEELWSSLGYKTLLADSEWPVSNHKYLVNDTVTIAVQINGKVRATITLPSDTDQKKTEELALANDDIAKALVDKQIKKVIVVPGRIVNVVAV